jgi:hypothetical protein
MTPHAHALNTPRRGDPYVQLQLIVNLIIFMPFFFFWNGEIIAKKAEKIFMHLRLTLRDIRGRKADGHVVVLPIRA